MRSRSPVVTSPRPHGWGAAWSPDGSQNVYSSSTTVDDPRTLWVVAAAGGVPTPSIAGTERRDASRLGTRRPDRVRPAHRRRPERHLAVEPDGSGARVLAETPGLDADLDRWSRDGESVVFVTVDGEQNQDVVVVGSDLPYLRTQVSTWRTSTHPRPRPTAACCSSATARSSPSASTVRTSGSSPRAQGRANQRCRSTAVGSVLLRTAACTSQHPTDPGPHAATNESIGSGLAGSRFPSCVRASGPRDGRSTPPPRCRGLIRAGTDPRRSTGRRCRRRPGGGGGEHVVTGDGHRFLAQVGHGLDRGVVVQQLAHARPPPILRRAHLEGHGTVVPPEQYAALR